VEEELSRYALVDAAGITIRNIDGNVALSGTASRPGQAGHLFLG
jgi:osmotically-inducible protein OsmY